MIGNDRVFSATASMLLVHKEDDMVLPSSTGVAKPEVFRQELIDRGLLIATGVPGIYGRSGEFEDTLDRVDRLVAAAGEADRPEVMRFPPVLNRAHFERSGYLESFPHLAGTIHSFVGTEQAHRQMLRSIHAGQDWSADFPATSVVLAPAACYPVYPALAGTLSGEGKLVDVMSYCFRHEPSDDAGRMQMFRMHEHVRVGTARTVIAWRETWLPRAMQFTRTLGLDAETVVASDPFFGRGGALLSASQRDQRLKLEIVTTVAREEQPTAIISLNYHQDHFAQIFGIRTADGAAAHRPVSASTRADDGPSTAGTA
jgi:hypothetical protein